VTAQFLNLCRAQPFRPFRVHTYDGQAIDVAAASQVGVSPGERLFVVVLADARFEVLMPERIARCELMTAGMPPPPEPPPVTTETDSKLSPGGISFMAFTAADGRKLVQFAATDADGTPILSSAGMWWDVHGMETFENGRTLYLHHADDLTLTRRIIIWPPDRATFESFAEAMDVKELQEALGEQGADAGRVGFSAPKTYLKSIRPGEPYVPPMPDLGGKHDGIAPDDPMRFVMSSKRYEAAPGHRAIAPAVTDLLTDHVMFDLLDSGWDASIKDDLAAWELTLRYAGDADRQLVLNIDAFKGLARVGDRTLPLEATERHLRNYPLHNSWEALLKRLTGEPRDLTLPEVVFGHESGARVEFWPGKTGIPAPFLTVRIVDAGGRGILDCRGSEWGAIVRVHGSLVVLNLIHADTKKRVDFKPRLALDLLSHRVTSEGIAGSTCLAVLQQAIHTCRTPEWLLEELGEWFAKGQGIPVP
jgi:hypothetical protein